MRRTLIIDPCHIRRIAYFQLRLLEQEPEVRLLQLNTQVECLPIGTSELDIHIIAV